MRSVRAVAARRGRVMAFAFVIAFALLAGPAQARSLYEYRFTFPAPEVLTDAVSRVSLAGETRNVPIPLDGMNLTRVTFALGWNATGPSPAPVRLTVWSPEGNQWGPIEDAATEGELSLAASPVEPPGEVTLQASTDREAWSMLHGAGLESAQGRGAWIARIEVLASRPDAAVEDDTRSLSAGAAWVLTVTGENYRARLDAKTPLATPPDDEPASPDSREGPRAGPRDEPPIRLAPDPGPAGSDEESPVTTPLLVGGALVGVAAALVVGLKRR